MNFLYYLGYFTHYLLTTSGVTMKAVEGASNWQPCTKTELRTAVGDLSKPTMRNRKLIPPRDCWQWVREDELRGLG